MREGTPLLSPRVSLSPLLGGDRLVDSTALRVHDLEGLQGDDLSRRRQKGEPCLQAEGWDRPRQQKLKAGCLPSPLHHSAAVASAWLWGQRCH